MSIDLESSSTKDQRKSRFESKSTSSPTKSKEGSLEKKSFSKATKKEKKMSREDSQGKLRSEIIALKLL